MAERKQYDIAVVGAGAGGLVIAVGAAQAGRTVLLIERGNWGGDSTNYGCVPSKTLIHAAHTAKVLRRCREQGVSGVSALRCLDALSHTRSVVAHFRAHEEPTALEVMGVDSVEGAASFIDGSTLAVRDRDWSISTVHADAIVLASGSRPRIPAVAGLDRVPYLTNETVFSLETIPPSLAIIGGGPVGCELAQAFARLGSVVHLIHRHERLLDKECGAAQQLVAELFVREGIALYCNHEPTNVDYDDGEYRLAIQGPDGASKTIATTHLLVAAGRLPNIEELQLEVAGVAYNERGVLVDGYGRTSRKHIWAVGDVVGRGCYTHVAEQQARTVLRNLLMPWPLRRRLDAEQAVPRVTFTDPEVASVGLDEKQAIARYGAGAVAVYHLPLNQVDRAVCCGETDGFISVVTKKWSSRILGATLVAPRAGEMLMELSTAMQFGIPLRKLSKLLHPYPSYSMGVRQAADGWLQQTVLPALRRWTGRR